MSIEVISKMPELFGLSILSFEWYQLLNRGSKVYLSLHKALTKDNLVWKFENEMIVFEI